MRYLRFSFLLLIAVSCAHDYKYLQVREADPTCVSKTAPREFHTGWYHASVDVVGRHLSGLLLVKVMPDSSHRVVFTNEAGVTFFDFGFSSEGVFQVYHIIKQLNKSPVVYTLRDDFELILGLPFRSGSLNSWSKDDEIFYGTSQKNKTAYFITTKDCASLRRLESGSGRKRKVTAFITGEYPRPEKIDLVHHTFDMKISLTRFEKE
jgi:hypothetical protein